mmetsp:Transcript_25620/g.75624  ORF Transcript_25620/g.75624 Transcript_25620/m.75624 type:complete len:201 (-) Transcript_25620:1738-2340(-)
MRLGHEAVPVLSPELQEFPEAHLPWLARGGRRPLPPHVEEEADFGQVPDLRLDDVAHELPRHVLVVFLPLLPHELPDDRVAAGHFHVSVIGLELPQLIQATLPADARTVTGLELESRVGQALHIPRRQLRLLSLLELDVLLPLAHAPPDELGGVEVIAAAGKIFSAVIGLVLEVPFNHLAKAAGVVYSSSAAPHILVKHF